MDVFIEPMPVFQLSKTSYKGPMEVDNSVRQPGESPSSSPPSSSSPSSVSEVATSSTATTLSASNTPSSKSIFLQRYKALRDAGFDDTTANKYSPLYSSVNEVIDAILSQSLNDNLAISPNSNSGSNAIYNGTISQYNNNSYNNDNQTTNNAITSSAVSIVQPLSSQQQMDNDNINGLIMGLSVPSSGSFLSLSSTSLSSNEYARSGKKPKHCFIGSTVMPNGHRLVGNENKIFSQNDPAYLINNYLDNNHLHSHLNLTNHHYQSSNGSMKNFFKESLLETELETNETNSNDLIVTMIKDRLFDDNGDDIKLDDDGIIITEQNGQSSSPSASSTLSSGISSFFMDTSSSPSSFSSLSSSISMTPPNLSNTFEMSGQNENNNNNNNNSNSNNNNNNNGDLKKSPGQTKTKSNELQNGIVEANDLNSEIVDNLSIISNHNHSQQQQNYNNYHNYLISSKIPNELAFGEQKSMNNYNNDNDNALLAKSFSNNNGKLKETLMFDSKQFDLVNQARMGHCNIGKMGSPFGAAFSLNSARNSTGSEPNSPSGASIVSTGSFNNNNLIASIENCNENNNLFIGQKNCLMKTNFNNNSEDGSTLNDLFGYLNLHQHYHQSQSFFNFDQHHHLQHRHHQNCTNEMAENVEPGSNNNNAGNCGASKNDLFKDNLMKIKNNYNLFVDNAIVPDSIFNACSTESELISNHHHSPQQQHHYQAFVNQSRTFADIAASSLLSNASNNDTFIGLLDSPKSKLGSLHQTTMSAPSVSSPVAPPNESISNGFYNSISNNLSTAVANSNINTNNTTNNNNANHNVNVINGTNSYLDQYESNGLAKQKFYSSNNGSNGRYNTKQQQMNNCFRNTMSMSSLSMNDKTMKRQTIEPPSPPQQQQPQLKLIGSGSMRISAANQILTLDGHENGVDTAELSASTPTASNGGNANSPTNRPTNLMGYKGLWVCNVSPDIGLHYLKRRFRRFGHFTGIQTFERRATNGTNIVFVHYDNPYSPIEAIATLHNYNGQDLCADPNEPLKLRFAPSMEQSRAGQLPTLEQARKIVEKSGECFNWRLSSGCHRGNRCLLKHISINREIDSQPWVKALKKKINEA